MYGTISGGIVDKDMLVAIIGKFDKNRLDPFIQRLDILFFVEAWRHYADMFQYLDSKARKQQLSA